MAYTYDYILGNAASIEEAVSIINNETIDHNTNELAGQYLFEAAVEGLDDNIDDVTEQDLEGQAEYLIEAGAKFDLFWAVDNALGRLKQASEDLHSGDSEE